MAPDFADATRGYYRWLHPRYLALDEDGLKEKRRNMDKRKAFRFLRGTFYLWRSQFAAAGTVVAGAPPVLSAGDAHLENFGTWRDAEGRLVWGVNDFDEAAELPFTSDLVRLATSLLVALRDEAGAELPGAEEGVAALLGGYRRGLCAGEPYVLEDGRLDAIRIAAVGRDDPATTWAEIREEGFAATPEGDDLRHLLLTALPPGSRDAAFRKVRKGLGSLGRARWLVVATWNGGPVAREAKAAAPSAAHVDALPASRIRDHRRLAAEARRAPDPGFLLTEEWVVRRRSPEMRKIELKDFLPPKQEDGAAPPDGAPPPDPRPGQLALLRAMGGEIANLHAGTAPDVAALAGWLDARRATNWLLDAARAAEGRVLEDHAAFRGDPKVVEEIPPP